MKVIDNEAGGKTVIVEQSDDLKEVPKSHRSLITGELRKAFADVPAYLQSLAERSPFAAMAQWLKAMAAEGRTRVELCQGYSKSYVLAGINLQHDVVRSALLVPASTSRLPPLPKSLAKFYRLVERLSWGGFGVGGGIQPVGKHASISGYAFDFHGDDVDLDETYEWGESACGDMLIYTADDRAGWLNHGSHEIVLQGSIADVIDGIFGEMLRGETPELKK